MLFWESGIVAREMYPVVCVLSGFSLLVSLYEYSFMKTVLLLPVTLLICFVIVRALRGFSPTFRGIRSAGQPQKRAEADWKYELIAHPINHYGEKLRWSMDLLGVSYHETNVGAILQSMFRGRSVPWLVDKSSASILGSSDEALFYLSAVYVPKLPQSQREDAHKFVNRDEASIAWEAKLSEMGHLVQGFAYYHLLGPSSSPLPTKIAWGGLDETVPWLERSFVYHLYPLLKFFMRTAWQFKAKQHHHHQRENTLNEMLDQVDEVLKKQDYLLGDHLSYIDIGFCSLMAPLLPHTILYSPENLYAKGRFSSFKDAFSASEFPDELVNLELNLLKRPCGQFVKRLYHQKRSICLLSKKNV